MNCRFMTGTHWLIVPLSLRSRLVTLAHECHQGSVRTKQRLRALFWWPKMDLQVQSTTAACVTCQLHDKTARTTHAPLTPVQNPACPWQKLAMDVVGPFEIGPASCTITLIDYYSKWPRNGIQIEHDSSNCFEFSDISLQPKRESTGDCYWQWPSISLFGV